MKNIKTTRVFLSALLVLCMCVSLFPSSLTAKTANVALAAKPTNIIVNGNFDEDTDLSEWSAHQNGATITVIKSEEPVVAGISTYGKISDRTSNYQAFAQDISQVVKNGEKYMFSFYVMLDAEDYKDAPAEQRTVEISPHIRVNGTDNYSQFVSGNVSQVLEPGVWTEFSGNFNPTWNGNLELLAIRILEQGTNYGQGAGVMGTYYVTGVNIYKASEDPELVWNTTMKPYRTKISSLAAKASKVDNSIVNLCDAVNEQLPGMIVGTSICNVDLADNNQMMLVAKHFNAITLGNELKPDAMFGYASSCPKKHTEEINGVEIEVPTLDFSRAEHTLNWIYAWNEANPDAQIKVRGHVLVWHSQTPDWWFYEDYDKKKELASPELMNLRLEWYIKTMCEHFTGEDSRYKGMFYGWDVVNEAVSDGSGDYRKASENSKWWAVYESNEFIINAFKYANKYMDPEVKLFYNDYGDSSWKKSQGIAKLLKDVKEAEGTRIDGMGMQGHYETLSSNPTIDSFESAARKYAEIVDEVQITEWDLAVSSTYDGTQIKKLEEYKKQALRYRSFYDAIIRMKEDGVNITGFTFWGVIDKNSWLQSRSNVGGGTDGKKKQLPLIFDDDYQAKIAFWAFADKDTFQQLCRDADAKVKELTEAEKAKEQEKKNNTTGNNSSNGNNSSANNQTATDTSVTDSAATDSTTDSNAQNNADNGNNNSNQQKMNIFKRIAEWFKNLFKKDK